jgi:RimJ/RimL family protein N-acetyltransferase
MDLQALNDLNEMRRAIRPLLSPASVADALATYYALWHDPRRTHLTLHRNAQGQVDGFIAVCQTGADLFRPLITLRAPGEEAVADLLRAALIPNRPYQMVVPATLAPALRTQLEISGATWVHIYRLDPSRFQPIINVLVQRVTSADGSPRFQISSQGQIVAMSGTNWRSPDFAEVFVYVHPQGRGRGWGRSVVSACTAFLLEERLRPLYMVDEGNEGSIRIAEGLGYVDTGLREFVGEGQLKQNLSPNGGGL